MCCAVCMDVQELEGEHEYEEFDENVKHQQQPSSNSIPKTDASADYDPVYEPQSLKYQNTQGNAHPLPDNYESPDGGYFLLENATTPAETSKFLASPDTTNLNPLVPQAYEVPSSRNPISSTSTDHSYDFPFSLGGTGANNNYETPFDADYTQMS